MAVQGIQRLLLGHFTVPEDLDDHRAGQKIVVCAYVIRHPRGIVLFDTGIGQGDADAEERYRPIRRSLPDALASVGLAIGDVRVVANCHLHFDHSGGNFRFPGTPIFAQRIELEAVHMPDYTIPAVVADFDGAAFELLDGEAEVLPGIRIVPSPGHVPGHQSMVVNTPEGRVFIAGQAYNEASRFAMARYALDVEERDPDEPLPEVPDWVRRVRELDPIRVVFAHDLAAWEPDRVASAVAT